MKTKPSHEMIASITHPQLIRKKNRRRHTRIQLDSLRPKPTSFQDSECPKCHGYVRTESGESLSQIIIRCVNCGWQPHFQAPIIHETDEARMFRSLSSQFVFESDWDRIPANF